MMVELINYFNSIRQLSDEATVGLLRVMKAKELRRGQVWLQEGAVCDKMTFVVKGMMKLYLEEGSREFILQIAQKDEWIMSIASYFNSTNSPYAIRSIERSVITYIMQVEITYLIEKYPELNYQFFKIAEMQAFRLEYHTALLLMPSKKGFDFILKNEIIGQLSDKQIAGYLGVSQNSICNWRKKSFTE